jgi:polysaccharide biosynthesis protein PslG
MPRLLPLAALLTAATLMAGCQSSGPEPAASGSTAPASPAATAPTSASAVPSASPSPSTSATTPAGPAVKVPAAVTGMHVAGVQAGAWPDSNVPFGTLRLWDSGTAWSQVEATKGRYDWTSLDRAVATAERHKVSDILLVLGSTPTWNAQKVGAADYPVPGAASPPRSVAAWDAFVKAVVTRYKGRITSYEVWNEASLRMFWNGSPEKLAELTKRAADIIHEYDPKALVVAASTTARLPGAFDHFFPRYLAALGKAGWPVDVFAAHLYPNSTGDTDTRSGYITQVKDALAAAGAPDLPIWDTELNYGLAGPGPTNPLQTIGGARARDWVVQTAFDSLAQGIARTYWYIWTPQPYPLLGMQLTNDSGAVKGLRVVEQWIVGGTTTGCTDDGSVVSCAVEKNGVPSVVAWAKDTAGTITAPAGLAQACTTANQCTPITGPVDLGETPVRLMP